METLNIKAEWDNEKTAWVASCEFCEELSIEADTIDELIEIIKPLIPQITLASQSDLPYFPSTIVLTKYWPVVSCVSVKP